MSNEQQENDGATSADATERMAHLLDAADDRSKGRQRNSNQKFSEFGTSSDEEFRNILRKRLEENPLAKDYPDIFAKAPDCFVRWRKRFAKSNPKLWKRLFDTERVLKEFVEAVPVLDAVAKLIEDDTRLRQSTSSEKPQTYTIIDLCSGKGYLGMILSEILPPSKVFRIVLMDKAWPMRNSTTKPQHINWEHIYGTYGKDGQTDESNHNENKQVSAPLTEEEKEEETSIRKDATHLRSKSCYYDTWPIPIDTSKQDLKSSRQLKQIQKHYLSNPAEHPVIVLAIHLCGILSLRAIDLFNTNPAIKFLALKPCCLPGMIHAKRHEIFRIGDHCFDASEVCVHGKWNKNKWENGPPRSHLQPKFHRWSNHLYHGIGWENPSNVRCTILNDSSQSNDTPPQALSCDDEKVRKVHATIRVQHGGGFQNDFLFAERMPVSSTTVWDGLDQYSSQGDLTRSC